MTIKIFNIVYEKLQTIQRLGNVCIYRDGWNNYHPINNGYQFVYPMIRYKDIKLPKVKPNLVSRRRHILKSITWRIIGTIDTMLLGWLVSGDPMVGLKVGGLELFTKMVLYYFHERAWYNFGLGIPKRKLFKRLKDKNVK